ncbi:MAG: hypothetical protein KatS3mg105_0765 [Gemmatales bacterium]|nr:MAG: hypothetical protein KatS3mg105_0765 [Gemmatales bacterium]
MGHFDKAKAAYRDLASSTSQLSIAVASHLGIARVCLKGNEYQEARELLGRLHLRRDSSEWPAELRDETRYLYAFSLVGAQLQEEPGPYNQALVGFSLGTLELERYLDWPLTGPNPGENTRPIQPKGPINVVLAAKNPIESLVSIQLVDVRVADLIDRLGQEVGFKAKWEPDTLGEIQEQLISVQLENVEAGHLLDELATVLGIAWRSKGGTIRFARSDSKVVLPTLAQRALREALLSQPGHPLGPAVMLELGRLEAKAGKNIGASAWFERVLESSPRSPVGVSAAYNLGQVQFRLGQYPSARENWFRVIDQAPRTSIGAARLLLDWSILSGNAPVEVSHFPFAAVG